MIVIDKLKFQLSQAKDAEEKYKAEIRTLKVAADKYEVLHKKFTDSEMKSQREISMLLERMSNHENNSKKYESIMSNYTKMRDNYQAKVQAAENYESENRSLRGHLSDATSTIESLKSQIETLRMTIHSQNQDIRIYKDNESFLKRQLEDQKSANLLIEVSCLYLIKIGS